MYLYNDIVSLFKIDFLLVGQLQFLIEVAWS